MKPRVSSDPTTAAEQRWREPIRAPDLSELETLVACATDGSLAAAAEGLGISRPAVAKRIRNLEALVGRPLLARDASGVQVTEAGESLIVAARRMLVERDRLMADMRQIRSGEPRYMDELRRLLGDREVGARVAHLAETRLADTQRLLELLLRASASAIVVADLDSGVLYEANPAYCNFAGRSRSELLGSRAHPDDTWYRSSERRAFVDEMRQAGVMEGYTTAMQRPDGTIRIGRGTSYVISVASQTVVLAIIEDITDRYEGPDEDMTKLGPMMR